MCVSPPQPRWGKLVVAKRKLSSSAASSTRRNRMSVMRRPRPFDTREARRTPLPPLRPPPGSRRCRKRRFRPSNRRCPGSRTRSPRPALAPRRSVPGPARMSPRWKVRDLDPALTQAQAGVLVPAPARVLLLMLAPNRPRRRTLIARRRPRLCRSSRNDFRQDT